MELKRYQRTVLNDIETYIELLSECGDCSQAYDQLWDSKGYLNGEGGVPGYKQSLKGVPDVCIKVPTGGGKTFIACASLKIIFDSMPRDNKLVMWFVPSTAILEQTLDALRNPNHPYRQRINTDFSGNVCVYNIDDLLYGHNFNPSVIENQLSICVLSYSSVRDSSVRSEKGDYKRMYRQNGALYPFDKIIGDSGGESELSLSLVSVINALSPVIVLDESHNADTPLTKQALEFMNPSFILEMTATPNSNSNIISIVTAGALKKENMVKLPLIVYGRPDANHVLFTTIDYRNTLEKAAELEYQKTGRYVRPIALIQAQPKNENDSITYDHIKELLVKSGIPEEQIAIKVSGKDELKNVNLSDRNCPIRYIITITALREGWDCPSAYILASIAKRSSTTEVEQIVGRVFRQPGASRFEDPILNMCYVITSSKTFRETLETIEQEFFKIGFTGKDYRVVNRPKMDDYAPPVEDHDEEDPIDPEKIKELTRQRGNGGGEYSPFGDDHTGGDVGGSSESGVIDLDYTRELGREFDRDHKGYDGEDGGGFTKYDRKAKMVSEFIEDAKKIKVPRFLYKDPLSIDGSPAILSDAALTYGFKLSKMDRQVNFALTDTKVGKWEISGNDSVLKYSVLSREELNKQYARFREVKTKDDTEVKKFTSDLIALLDRRNDIISSEIVRYVKLIVDDMSIDVLNNAMRNIRETADKIKLKIDTLAKDYRVKQFSEKCMTSDIFCDLTNNEGCYLFPEKIDPHDKYKSSISYNKSLYERCQGVSGLEERILEAIDGCDNILWWHRIVSNGKDEFSLNGPITHYPDFIARTKTGVTVLIEAKGSQLDNPDTQLKMKIGSEWERCAGSAFKYFMVFEYEEKKAEGSISAAKMKEYLSKLKP